MYLLVAEAIEYKRDPEKARAAYIKAAEERRPGEITTRLADISITMGTKVRELLPEKAHASGAQYHNYPETPGEAGRNDQIDLIRTHSNQLDDTISIARSRSHSRVGSIRSVASHHENEDPVPSPTGQHRRRSTLDVPATAHVKWTEQSGMLSAEPMEDDNVSVVSEILLQQEHDLAPSGAARKKRGLSFPVGADRSTIGPSIHTPAIVLTPIHNRTMSEPQPPSRPGSR
jgi:hypothetical protein